jgi:hypothetical protein
VRNNKEERKKRRREHGIGTGEKILIELCVGEGKVRGSRVLYGPLLLASSKRKK